MSWPPRPQALSAPLCNCSVTDQNPEGKYEALNKYGRDLTAAAKEGKLDPVIGRDDEIRRCIQVGLSWRPRLARGALQGWSCSCGRRRVGGGWGALAQGEGLGGDRLGGCWISFCACRGENRFKNWQRTG